MGVAWAWAWGWRASQRASAAAARADTCRGADARRGCGERSLWRGDRGRRGDRRRFEAPALRATAGAAGAAVSATLVAPGCDRSDSVLCGGFVAIGGRPGVAESIGAAAVAVAGQAGRSPLALNMTRLASGAPWAAPLEGCASAEVGTGAAESGGGSAGAGDASGGDGETVGGGRAVAGSVVRFSGSNENDSSRLDGPAAAASAPGSGSQSKSAHAALSLAGFALAGSQQFA